MQHLISNKVYHRIREFYDNAMLKYPHSYFPDEADTDTDKVFDELYKVGTNGLWHKNNSVVRG